MDNVVILNEIYKGAKMGMESISYVTEKVQDINLKDNLVYQYNEYQKIAEKVSTKLQDIDKIPEDTPIAQKFMGWSGVQLNTLTDKSNSQIADLLIQGTTMGIIKGIQLLHSHSNLDKEVEELLNTFIKMQENNIEKLKEFL